MAVSVRGAATRASWLLATVATLLAFRLLAATLTAHHLAQEARSELAVLEAGQPLWRWTFTTTEDIIAGRAFGHADVQLVDGGLRFTSRDGKPFELGLPIGRRLDLVHWPILRLDRRGVQPIELSILWQAAGSATCASTPVTWRAARIDVDLRAVQARAAGSAGPCTLPPSVRMLRLRLTLPPGQTLDLRGAALVAPDPDKLVPMAAAIGGSASDPAAAVPIIRMATTASAEALLARRDEVTRVRPAAIAIVDGTSLAGRPARSPPRWLSWVGAAVYALALLVVARRPRPALPTLLAGMSGPLILIAGLQWGQRPAVPGVIVFASALAFVFHVQRHRAPASEWLWVGNWRSAAWWWPLALLPVALAVSLIWGHALEPVPPRRAVVYLGWAVLQQWLILGFALGRLERLLPTRWAIFGAALLFALLHVPNGALIQLCFLAELWWAWCFVRQRIVLPIALAHAACALVVGAGLVGAGLRSLEVSARFFL